MQHFNKVDWKFGFAMFAIGWTACGAFVAIYLLILIAPYYR
jgi:hypothetical protein